MGIDIKVFRPDGTTRAISSKPFAGVFRDHKAMPARASHVRALTTGPHAGWFEADMAPLAAIVERDEFRVVLGPFESYEEAVAAERQWLMKNWVLAEA